jgi:putative NADH-flavin reductase
MRIALVGAHSKTGRLVAECARSLGHRVRSLEGDALELRPLVGAIHGTEVVISTVGPVKDSPAHLCSRATWRLLEAMEKEGVARLVMVTEALCSPVENLSPLHLALLCIPSLARAIEDRRRQESLVKHSHVHWTLVRPPRLTDDDTPGEPEVMTQGKIGAFDRASRRHLAQTLVRAAITDQWARQEVYVRS